MPSATDINQDAHSFICVGQNGGHGTSVDNFPIRREFAHIKSSQISIKTNIKNQILRYEHHPGHIFQNY